MTTQGVGPTLGPSPCGRQPQLNPHNSTKDHPRATQLRLGLMSQEHAVCSRFFTSQASASYELLP
jgi:hypothetical protein